MPLLLAYSFILEALNRCLMERAWVQSLCRSCDFFGDTSFEVGEEDNGRERYPLWGVVGEVVHEM